MNDDFSAVGAYNMPLTHPDIRVVGTRDKTAQVIVMHGERPFVSI
jgi:hypothetical protein